MRIANPPQQIPTAIAVSGVASPATLTPSGVTVLSANSTTVIAAIPNQREFIVQNQETAGYFLVGGSTAGSTNTGLQLAFGGVLTLTTAADVRLSNPTTGDIRLSYTQTGG